MSFYSYTNADYCMCPGQVSGEGLNGISERVCIQVNKVYDSCLQQQQLDKQTLNLTDVQPVGCEFCTPLTFVGCRSCGNPNGTLRDLCVERLCDRPNFARVRGYVDIELDVLFCDANGRQGCGRATLTVRKDVILYVPDESIIPYEIAVVSGAVCVTGDYKGNFTFEVTICVTIILKVIAEVELMVPSYGFCQIPPCEEFAENVCDEFFGLPIFPPVMDCDNNSSGGSCCSTVSSCGCNNSCGCNSGCGNNCCKPNTCCK